ncbi:MAG: aldo/keto reductase, partial [Geminicoccales bacterium]
RDQTLRRIGERHGKTPGQVTLRWLVQQEGVLAIPKSSKEDHARSNFAIFDFELSGQELAAISGLARPDGRLINPAGVAPSWDR